MRISQIVVDVRNSYIIEATTVSDINAVKNNKDLLSKLIVLRASMTIEFVPAL